MIDADEFRRVLGHFATGVTLLTTRDADGRPAGLTASAFTSVSLEPPLVLVCVDHKATCFPAFVDSDRFGVNILRDDQETLSRRFATSRLDKFDGVDYAIGAFGVPLVADALAQLECTIVNRHAEGDHTILIGRVEHAHTAPGQPLLYYRGQYDRLSGVPS